MKLIWTIFLLTTAGHAADVTLRTTGQNLVSNPVWDAATDLATRMFAKVGVRLEWKAQNSEAPADGVAVQVKLIPDMPGHAEAMAFANPFSSPPVIIVMYDRIQFATDRVPGLRGALLAHVLVHEIGHVLMKSDAHSPVGVMKAEWSGSDYSRIANRLPLRFSPADAELIRRLRP